MMNHLKNINWNGQTFGFDLLMINDHQRNQFYQQSLRNCGDKIVLDIGSGTGILSVMAVQAGARHVYSFESDPQNCYSAQAFVKSAGLHDRITMVCADILAVDRHCWTHDPIDIIMTETFANDCFTENFAFLVEHVERSFNLASQHRWIPEIIELHVSMIDIEPRREFDPGVSLPDAYIEQIQSAVEIYRDHFYHAHDQINLAVSQIPKSVPQDNTPVAQFWVRQDIRDRLGRTKLDLQLDHSIYTNPYLKVDWCITSGEHRLWLNQAASWRSIAFKIDPAGGHKFYLRFNPLTHALIASQS